MTKKILALLIVVSAFVMSTTIAYAGIDFDEEADALNKMHLLSGDGVDYNLYGKLKRSEAATFIVKVKGVQNEVMQSKEKYSGVSTTFDDVVTEDWFAPYVGYCMRNGIVSGFPDGTYRPDEYVTEKQFYSMLLGAMEYDADRDYSWDTVLNKAYEVGISDKIEHAVSSEDNSDYYRKDVVHSIFLSLDKKMDDIGISVVENLIDKGVTNESNAKKYGVYRTDELETAVVKSVLEDYRTLVITLNEDIEQLVSSQVEIKAGNREINVDSMSTDGEVVTIKLQADAYKGPTYEVELRDVTDENGYVIDTLELTFSGIASEEVVSDNFRIKGVDVVDEDKALVHFTHPVSDDADNVLYYRFGEKGDLEEGSFRNLDVMLLDGMDDAVLLEFTDLTLESGKTYEISIRGDLKSAYDAYMNRGEGDTYSFYGKNETMDDFEVDDLEVFDSHFLRVKFNRPVDVESGFERSNYKIRDKVTNGTQQPTKIYYEMDEDGVVLDTLMLKFSALREEREYEISIDDVYDIYESSYIHNFDDEIVGDDYEDAPELDDVEINDRSTIVLIYDRPLSEDAEDLEIDLDHGIDVEKVRWFEEEPEKLYVYLEKGNYLDEDEDYELEIDDSVSDYLGISSEEDEFERFPGTDDYLEDIEIDEVVDISPGVLLVRFNEYIDISKADDSDLYTLEYRVDKSTKKNDPTNVTIVDSKTIILSFDTYTTDYKSTLCIEQVVDPSGQYTYEELEFDVGKLE